jgi:hypothetical protein
VSTIDWGHDARRRVAHTRHEPLEKRCSSRALVWADKLDAYAHIYRGLKKPAGMIHFPHKISLAYANSEV